MLWRMPSVKRLGDRSRKPGSRDRGGLPLQLFEGQAIKEMRDTVMVGDRPRKDQEDGDENADGDRPRKRSGRRLP